MRRVLLLIACCVSIVTGQLQAQTIREVRYNARAVVPVNAKLRFTTMIVLPDGEDILDVVCGDKDFWVISGAQNLAYVKPARAGATTNLNLITAAGHIYAFLLTEGAPDPDLTIYIAPEAQTSPSVAVKKFYSASQVEALQREVDEARKDAVAAREAASQSMDASNAVAERAAVHAEETITAFRAAYPLALQFPYRFVAHVKPFWVSAIFHDDHFTYIRAEGNELPTLYEMRDGLPNLVNFDVQDGLFIVPKVLEQGYLAVGKRRLVFDRVR